MAIIYGSIVPAGTFPDVDYVGTDLYTVVQVDQTLYVYKNNVVIQTGLLVAGTLAFPRIKNLGCTFRNGANAYFWPDITAAFSTAELLGPSWGNYPTVLDNTYVAWQAGNSNYTVQRRLRAGGATVSLGTGRPTGLNRILSSGAVVMVDTDRNYPNNQNPIGTLPDYADNGVIVMERAIGGVIVQGLTQITLLPTTNAFTPKIASGTGDILAIVAWSSGTTHLITLTSADLAPPSGGGGGGGPVPGGGIPSASASPRRRVIGHTKPQRVYPRLPEITHEPTASTVQMLWDKIWTLEDRVSDPTATSALREGISSLERRVSTLQTDTDRRFSQMQTGGATTGQRTIVGGGSSAGGGGSEPGGGGGGGGTLPNQLAVVEAARVTYDAYTGIERAGRITNHVAWELRNQGVGLVFKNFGNQYRDRSIDVIMVSPGGDAYDILGDAEGDANPQWSNIAPIDIDRWRAPVDPTSF